MQSDEGDFTKVSGVHVRDDVKQQAKHLPYVRLEARRKLIRVFGGEVGLIADGALRVSHHVVDILGRGTAVLLAFFIVPQIGSGRIKSFLLNEVFLKIKVFYRECQGCHEIPLNSVN